MGRLVVLGAGIAGHTAATFAKKWLGDQHEVVVISPNSKWNWIPSNIWVGVGYMKPDDVIFELAPVYEKAGIVFKQAKALSIHPEGGEGEEKPYVTIEYTDPSKKGQNEKVTYDYLINATGPKLNFAATEGLGPDGGNSVSVCTYLHAAEAANALNIAIEKMKKGEKQKFLIGVGHGMCTCQGAAFEYIFNVEHTLREKGVRDKAEITYISNEYELGDFGVGGMHIKRGGYITSGKVFAESLFTERGVHWIKRAHVNKVEKDRVHYETLDGTFHEKEFDFAMLIPPFAGAGLKAYDKEGNDITSEMFNPGGFMFVDADYSSASKPYEEWSVKDWPKTYQTPKYKNIFAAGIAFAPPHLISKPMKSPNGTPINPTPPRTGMPSGIIGKAVAASVVDMMTGKSDKPTHKASMGEMGAACVASAGAGFFKGTAAAMTMYPVIPDYEKYPNFGRDLNYTFGELGLAGHWIKHILHYMFIYKAKLKPGWTLIPE
ncbi:NAD(P)/FAD-dependent oxidoreductase [Nitrosophilus alvini]|uniref:NAD(P)/FAD-dependent oxidoreductase n=1 Tax=Nitrosophilus alvini TaxID=2714855 RepID=UPI001909F422|nr:FAD-dependent oxidoreductase [Nitrosophilus alvini]